MHAARLRRISLRPGATIVLATWLASAFMAQVTWLHVETEHHGDRHVSSDCAAWTGVHSDDHGAHEHQAHSARTPATVSVRAELPAPILQAILLAAPDLAPRLVVDPRSTPRTRGSPLQKSTVLRI